MGVCLELTEGRNRRRAVVNAVMNYRFPQNAENFLTSWGLVGFSEGLCSAELWKVWTMKYEVGH